MPPKISVVVLAWNGAAYLDACLDALLAQAADPAQLEVIVVDNASTDASADLAARRGPPVRLIRNARNLGYAGGNNVGLAAATGDLLVLLNQDTRVNPGWLNALAHTFDLPEVGIVGCKAYYADGCTLQHAGAYVRPGDAFAFHRGQGELDQGQYSSVEDVEYVTGAALALHRRVLQALGPLDEGYAPAYYEDIDFCFRARRAGFRVIYQPAATLIHHESTSLPAHSYPRVASFHRNRVRFVLKHCGGAALESFTAAERQAIQSGLWVDDAAARARAYWDNLLAWPGLAASRQADPTLGGGLAPAEAAALLDDLQALRQLALSQVTRLFGEPHPARSGAAAGALAAQLGGAESWAARAGVLQGRLDALRTQAPLQEGRFTSRKRLLGPLVVGFRQLWISIATRWYILPVLQQQSAVNAQVADLLAEVLRHFHNQNRQLEVLLRVLSADDAAALDALRAQLGAPVPSGAASDREVNRDGA